MPNRVIRTPSAKSKIYFSVSDFQLEFAFPEIALRAARSFRAAHAVDGLFITHIFRDMGLGPAIAVHDRVS
jgi:hypothetical protein